MVTSESCGREFKNTQGLRGHKTFVHNERSLSNTPATKTATVQLMSNLEDRLDKLEYVTGLREPSILDKYLYDKDPLSIQLSEVAEQLSGLTQQMASFSSNASSNTEYREIEEQVTQLAQQLHEVSTRFSPNYPVADAISQLEHELSNRAKNVRVDFLENRLTQLQNRQIQSEQNLEEGIKGNTALIGAQIDQVLMVIGRLVDKFDTLVERLQRQRKEPK